MAASTGSKSGANTDTEELKAEIALLRKELADLVKHVSEIGDKSARTARNAASSKTEQLRAQGEAAFEDLRDNALDYERQVTDAVREKPISSLAIAAGVGFFFALLTRR